MKIPSPYFENVPMYGNLELEQILVEYVYPLLSILQDAHGTRYLCMCFDTRGAQQWLIVPISTEELIKLLTNRVTLEHPFRHSSALAIHAVHDYASKTDSFRTLSPEELSPEILPAPGEYLDAEAGEWDSYIEALRSSSSAWISCWTEAPIYTSNIGQLQIRIPEALSNLYQAAVSSMSYCTRSLCSQRVPCRVSE